MATHHRTLALAAAAAIPAAALLLAGPALQVGAQEAADNEMAPPMMSQEILRDPVLSATRSCPSC